MIVITKAERKKWIHLLAAVRKSIHNVLEVPKTIIYYELDMLERGIHILPDRGYKLQDTLEGGIGGMWRFVAQGDPTALLSSIKGTLLYGVKIGIRKLRGALFKTAYWIDAFRLYIVLRKMKLEDQQLKERYLELGESESGYNNDDEKIDLLKEIKDALKKFEKEI